MSLEVATPEQMEQSGFNTITQTSNHTLTVDNQTNMANSPIRALTNTTVSDSLSYSSASPVLSVSPNLLCVKQFQQFMHFPDRSHPLEEYSGSEAGNLK